MSVYKFDYWQFHMKSNTKGFHTNITIIQLVPSSKISKYFCVLGIFFLRFAVVNTCCLRYVFSIRKKKPIGLQDVKDFQVSGIWNSSLFDKNIWRSKLFTWAAIATMPEEDKTKQQHWQKPKFHQQKNQRKKKTSAGDCLLQSDIWTAPWKNSLAICGLITEVTLLGEKREHFIDYYWEYIEELGQLWYKKRRRAKTRTEKRDERDREKMIERGEGIEDEGEMLSS